jgi:hypothetical protein
VNRSVRTFIEAAALTAWVAVTLLVFLPLLAEAFGVYQ